MTTEAQVCECGKGPSALEHWHTYPGTDLEIDCRFTPGYNCPKRGGSSHGVHGMEILWLLRGPKGVIQFKVFTRWVPGTVSPGHGLAPDCSYSARDVYPYGADLGYHARVPQYEEQTLTAEHCDVLGGPCYYDGSGLRADALAKRFVVEGEQAIWDALIADYLEIRTTISEGGEDA